MMMIMCFRNKLMATCKKQGIMQSIKIYSFDTKVTHIQENCNLLAKNFLLLTSFTSTCSKF